jgi:UDP-glucose 4-epimerase
LLELARAANVRRVINASTGGALLGELASPISEEMAPCPLSPYGTSKLAVEGYCSAFARAYGFSCVTLRFSNIYGPRSAHKKSVVAAFSKVRSKDRLLLNLRLGL